MSDALKVRCIVQAAEFELLRLASFFSDLEREEDSSCALNLALAVHGLLLDPDYCDNNAGLTHN